MNIADNLRGIKDKLPAGIKLVAVSKTKPNELIMEAYHAGHRVFGENKPQDLKRKYEELPKDIEWHFIGHLQSNKVKYIAPFVNLIHAVDSIKLLQVIEKEAKKNNRIIKCLLQIHIAEEDTKFGFAYDDLNEMLDSDEFQKLTNIQIEGLMGMATFTDDYSQVRREFRSLKGYFDDLKGSYFSKADNFRELSMGMSDDYPIAIEEGSTIIRVGSSIFGARNYAV